MSTILQILGWWTLLSCILGPSFAWSFFGHAREEREEGGIEARRDEAHRGNWATPSGLRGST